VAEESTVPPDDGSIVLARELHVTGAITRIARGTPVATTWPRRVDLSQRAREMIALDAEGCSNPAIVRRLFVTQRTVEWHVKRIFRKLGLTRPEAGRRALAVLAFLRPM
jgi:DNA-binding NarL/FixJ family response regulator